MPNIDREGADEREKHIRVKKLLKERYTPLIYSSNRSTNLEKLTKAELENLNYSIRQYTRLHTYDYFTGLLVYKRVFGWYEYLVFNTDLIDNGLSIVCDEVRRFLNQEPLSIIFESHDIYTQITRYEARKNHKLLRTKFMELLSERFKT